MAPRTRFLVSIVTTSEVPEGARVAVTNVEPLRSGISTAEARALARELLYLADLSDPPPPEPVVTIPADPPVPE